MSHAHGIDKRQVCEGCGSVPPPWDLRELRGGTYCFPCQETLRGDCEVAGDIYPAHQKDYDATYEQQAFDSAVVNERVR